MSFRSRNSSGANYFLTGGGEPAELEIKEGFVVSGRYSLDKLLGVE